MLIILAKKFWKNIFPIGLLISLLGVSGCGVRSHMEEISVVPFRIEPFSPPTPVKKHARVMIDPGHGGRDAGCMSHRDDYEEKALTLTTSMLVQDILRRMGYEVFLTRNRDLYVPLSARADLANRQEVDLFVSIHYNYAFSEEANGVEVFYFKDEHRPEKGRITQSRKCAQQVLSTVVEGTRARSRGVKQANFAVIRETHMPAILIEAGFLSNKIERQKLKDPQYMRTLSESIAKGVDRYLSLAKGERNVLGAS